MRNLHAFDFPLGSLKAMRRILVTGAAGLLGRFVVDELASHGYALRGMSVIALRPVFVAYPEATFERLRRLHGDAVPMRDPGLYARQPFAPLYDLTHAARRLGFVAAYDQRHLLAGSSHIPTGERQ